MQGCEQSIWIIGEKVQSPKSKVQSQKARVSFQYLLYLKKHRLLPNMTFIVERKRNKIPSANASLNWLGGGYLKINKMDFEVVNGRPKIEACNFYPLNIEHGFDAAIFKIFKVYKK